MLRRIENKAVLAVERAYHGIFCPKCRAEMKTITMVGIHIEKCPECEGMFFDKGEAELLVRRHLRIRAMRQRIWSWFKLARAN